MSSVLEWCLNAMAAIYDLSPDLGLTYPKLPFSRNNDSDLKMRMLSDSSVCI